MQKSTDGSDEQTTINTDATDADRALVTRILDEIEFVDPLGATPHPTCAVFHMRRDADMYDREGGTRRDTVAVHADRYGDPSYAAKWFAIRYTEAFDQVINFGPDEWVAIHRFLRSSGWAGLGNAPQYPDRLGGTDEVIA